MDIKDRKMVCSGLIRRASFLISGETGFYCGYPWKHCIVPVVWDLALSPLSLYVSPRLLLKKEKTNKQINKQTRLNPQVAQARNMGIADASALLRNIRNIKIFMWKKPTVSVTYENERTSIKNSLPCIKCVLHLSCVVHEPIYGRFRGCTVNGFLSLPEGISVIERANRFE